MLDAILNHLPSEARECVGFTLHGLHVRVGAGGAALSVLPQAGRYDPDMLFLDPTALRELANLLCGTAKAIEAETTAELPVA